MAQGSSETPVQLLVAAFQNEDGAEEVLQGLKSAKREGLIGIQNVAILRRDQNDKLHIRELKDWGGGRGAVFGGVLGAAVGLLAGPGVLAAGAAGALIGGLAAKLRDSGFSNERLQAVGASLKPGTSAIVAVVEHKWVAELQKEMEEAATDVITMSIASDIAEQLDVGREVAYTALTAAEGTAVGRISVGDEGVEVGGIVLTEEGLVAGNAVITDEGAAGERLEIGDEGAVYEAAATAGGETAYAAAVTDGENLVVVGAATGDQDEEEEK